MDSLCPVLILNSNVRGSGYRIRRWQLSSTNKPISLMFYCTPQKHYDDDYVSISTDLVAVIASPLSRPKPGSVDSRRQYYDMRLTLWAARSSKHLSSIASKSQPPKCNSVKTWRSVFKSHVATQKQKVYFGEIDLVYDQTDQDSSPERYCHVTYEDDDAEDYSYSEYKVTSQFYNQSTIIGERKTDLTVGPHNLW